MIINEHYDNETYKREIFWDRDTKVLSYKDQDGTVRIFNFGAGLSTHLSDYNNPHQVTKLQVGLGSVDNTSDLEKTTSGPIFDALGTKQNTLVSGTNIKTINGSSLLGSGDLTLSTANFATDDLTLTGARTHDLAGFPLSFVDGVDPLLTITSNDLSIVGNHQIRKDTAEIRANTQDQDLGGIRVGTSPYLAIRKNLTSSFFEFIQAGTSFSNFPIKLSRQGVPVHVDSRAIINSQLDDGFTSLQVLGAGSTILKLVNVDLTDSLLTVNENQTINNQWISPPPIGKASFEFRGNAITGSGIIAEIKNGSDNARFKFMGNGDLFTGVNATANKIGSNGTFEWGNSADYGYLSWIAGGTPSILMGATGTKAIRLETGGGTKVFLESSGDLSIGNGATGLGAKLGIKSVGNAFTDKSLLIQNFAGTGNHLEVTGNQTLYNQSFTAPPVGEASHQFKGFGTGSSDKLLNIVNGSGTSSLSIFGDLRKVFSMGLSNTYSNGTFADGTIEMLNFSSGTALPSIVGSSSLSSGLAIVSRSSETFVNGGLVFDNRDFSGGSFSDLTKVAHSFRVGGINKISIYRNGNFGIGSDSDLGTKLGIKSTGNTFANKSLLIQNQAGTGNHLEVTGNQTIHDQSFTAPPLFEASHQLKGYGTTVADYLVSVSNHTAPSTPIYTFGATGRLAIGEQMALRKGQLEVDGRNLNLTDMLVAYRGNGGQLGHFSHNGSMKVGTDNSRNITFDTTRWRWFNDKRISVEVPDATSFDIGPNSGISHSLIGKLNVQTNNSASPLQYLQTWLSTGKGINDVLKTINVEGAEYHFLTGGATPSVLTDSYIQYSKDITAGNAAPHFRTENGDIVKIYAAPDWILPTGTLTRTSFDPSTVTLPALAQRVAALITDLFSGHGLLRETVA